MSKFSLALALVVLAVAQGYPQSQAEISDAASNGNWDLVHDLLQRKFKMHRNIWEPSQSVANVRSLKPPAGGHVFGEAEYTFQSSNNEGGKKTQTKGGHKVVNRDGVITEYDFDPTF